MDPFPDDHSRHHRPRAAPRKPAHKRLHVDQRSAVAAMAVIAALALVTGGAGGVVLSPDPEATGSPRATPLDEATVRRIAGEIVDQAILVYHIHDHGLEEASPSPSQTASPTSLPAPASTSAPTQRRSTTPTATARPRPTSTVRPAPSAAPSPCLRPGKPSVGQDPCKWPHN